MPTSSIMPIWLDVLLPDEDRGRSDALGKITLCVVEGQNTFGITSAPAGYEWTNEPTGYVWPTGVDELIFLKREP